MISVVIPLYNKEQSVAATIQSVLAQTYTDYEIVVVDDGCSDASVSVVQTQMQNTDKIRLIRQKNAGVSAARNTGIRNAQGEYVAFLDADDYWEPTYLEVSSKLINDFPCAGIYGTTSGYIIGNHKYGGHRLYQHHRGFIDNPWVLGSPFSTSATVISKKVFDTIEPFDVRITHGEDLDMWWRVMLAYPCVYEDVVLSYYRLGAENSVMAGPIPLERHLPYFIDKYEEARSANSDFCRFFDREVAYRLYPYLFNKTYKTDAKRIAKKIDYSLQKKSIRLRMQFPYLYRWYQILFSKKHS